MITIITSTSRIIGPGGDLASGQIIITPNVQFNYTDGSDPKKVTTQPKVVDFTDGILDASFTLAPTTNASQNKTNLYYKAEFVTDGGNWTEYWVFDGTSQPYSVEITAIVKVVPDPVASTEDYIAADEVSVTPVADGVPRARADGTLAPAWFNGIPGSVLVYSYTDATIGGPIPQTSPPAGVLLADGYDSGSDQCFVWAGGRWRVTGG